MTSIIKGKFSKLQLNTDDILKEIELNELSKRKDASRHAVKVMKDNANSRGMSTPGGYPSRQSGTLFKSIGYKLLKKDRSAMIGSKDFKIHLLEFGHGDGKQRNKRPLIRPSLLQAEGEIIRIMSERYF
jgi:hypothetical protein